MRFFLNSTGTCFILLDREYFSRKDAKAQRNALETRQRFAPLREKYFLRLDVPRRTSPLKFSSSWSNLERSRTR
jgi:hypothetical protein